MAKNADPLQNIQHTLLLSHTFYAIKLCSPLLLAVTQKSSIVRRVNLSSQSEQHGLAKLQRQRKLPPDLPHTVQQQQKGWALVLQTGVRVGRTRAALLEGVSSLKTNTS